MAGMNPIVIKTVAQLLGGEKMTALVDHENPDRLLEK
jgi:hypothetical protein